jgi:hypothetical protein
VDGAFEGSGGFFVELLKEGFETTFDQIQMEFVVGM